jgi:WD40 repeat protein
LRSQVWDVGTGKLIRAIIGHKGDIQQLLFVNAENLLLSASADATVRLWEFVRYTSVLPRTASCSITAGRYTNR